MKLRRIKWAGPISDMGKMKYIQNFRWKTLEEELNWRTQP
jgi:hypothetical protein